MWWGNRTLMVNNSPNNHLWSEFSLLFGDGGAEVAAFGDPVRLNCPEKPQNSNISIQTRPIQISVSNLRINYSFSTEMFMLVRGKTMFRESWQMTNSVLNRTSKFVLKYSTY